jgi:putative IMPACT (imprinted ancient) family translation regulator
MVVALRVHPRHLHLLFPARARPAHTLIARGPIIRLKKCRFQAAVARIENENDVAAALAEITKDKKIARATHPAIAAWRCRGADGFDDCGESGAGQRLHRLLSRRGDDGVLVAVTRWYGGSHLGPARFRAITGAAKDALRDAAGS